jgi:hypothetical protein
MDLDRRTALVVAVMDETAQPAQISLWLSDAQKKS